MDRGVRIKQEWITSSAEETIEVGREIGKSAKKNSIICLFGDLGAGKTTLVKGIVEGVTGVGQSEVSSPTFVYLNLYTAKTGLTVYHFDLYRLKNAAEFLERGFQDMLFASGICCIEWSERIESILPEERLNINIYHQDGCARKISYEESVV